MKFGDKYVFHVHTYRCGHAGDESDEDYVKKAIELGAESIIFTDHAPFPGDVFTNRMKENELAEYIGSLKSLRGKYQYKLDIQIGLEVEYMPSYEKYYERLKDNKDIDILILGQHHYELEDGRYSFQCRDLKNEYVGLFDAMIEGVKTGYFEVVAHPDRAFRREKEWTKEMAGCSEMLINEAVKEGIALEKNYSSMDCENMYWQQFWEMVPGKAEVVYGSDAHCTDELVVVGDADKER